VGNSIVELQLECTTLGRLIRQLDCYDFGGFRMDEIVGGLQGNNCFLVGFDLSGDICTLNTYV